MCKMDGAEEKCVVQRLFYQQTEGPKPDKEDLSTTISVTSSRVFIVASIVKSLNLR